LVVSKDEDWGFARHARDRAAQELVRHQIAYDHDLLAGEFIPYAFLEVGHSS
jgi:hypothetical protein